MSPRQRPPRAWTLALLFGFALALGGCADELDGLLDSLLSGTGLKEVSVANATGQEVSGAITVTGPSGAPVLEEEFHLQPGNQNQWFQFNLTAEGDSALATFGGAFSEPGRYGVSVELKEEVGGMRSMDSSVQITVPGEQRLLVVLDASREPPIEARRIPPADTSEAGR